MAFNLNEILAEISSAGILKTNKFMVEISLPLSLRNKPEIQTLKQTNYKLQLYCEQTNLPGFGLLTANIHRYGYGATEKKPYNPIFTDISLSFRGDGDGNVLRFFQTWMKSILNFEFRDGVNTSDGDKTTPQYPWEVAYKYDPKNNTGYATNVVIHVYSDDGAEVYQVTLRQAFPILVGDQSLSWASNNEYMKIPVIMTFFDWYDSSNQIESTSGVPLNPPPVITGGVGGSGL